MNDKELLDVSAVCDDCAQRHGFTQKNKAIGIWMGECDICHERKACSNLWHDWRRVK